MGKPSPAPFPGTQRFQAVRRLGQGGMGTVFAALDRDHGTTVALKTLNQLSADGLLLFKNEFRALADLHHENLVSLYELVEDQGQWFFTMELIPGTDFISYVRPLSQGAAAPDAADADEGVTSDLPLSPAPTPPMSLPLSAEASPMSSLGASQLPHAGELDELRLRSALVQLGRGLLALHSADKIHRDIKPHELCPSKKGCALSPCRRRVRGQAMRVPPETSPGSLTVSAWVSCLGGCACPALRP